MIKSYSKLNIYFIQILILSFLLSACKKNNPESDKFTLSNFNLCTIEFEAIGHYTEGADYGNGIETMDYDNGFSGENIIVPGSFLDNIFTGTIEINLTGGSIDETIIVTLNDNHDMIVSVSGSRASYPDDMTEMEGYNIDATDIPVLPDFDSNFAEFQIHGVETCNNVTLTHFYQTATERYWELNGFECDSDSYITIRFENE